MLTIIAQLAIHIKMLTIIAQLTIHIKMLTQKNDDFTVQWPPLGYHLTRGGCECTLP